MIETIGMRSGEAIFQTDYPEQIFIGLERARHPDIVNIKNRCPEILTHWAL